MCTLALRVKARRAAQNRHMSMGYYYTERGVCAHPNLNGLSRWWWVNLWGSTTESLKEPGCKLRLVVLGTRPGGGLVVGWGTGRRVRT
jgi:hypothetical protein